MTLDGYDWQEAFGYAARPDRVEGASCSTDPVLLADVVEVKHATEGENDGDSWIACGRLRDGRWFCLSAWCDFTGWDCQAGGRCWVADDYAELVQFGMGDDERSRWGLG